MDYATMPAGPEMDRLVAERVMGWRDSGPDRFAGLDKRPPLEPCKWIDVDGRERHRINEWFPSTNIAHAWEVLRACVWLELPVRIHFSLNGFDVTIGAHGSGCEFPCDDEDAIDAPRAICRAALIAVENRSR